MQEYVGFLITFDIWQSCSNTDKIKKLRMVYFQCQFRLGSQTEEAVSSANSIWKFL